MKKTIITLSLFAIAYSGYSQKIGLKFIKQNVTVVAPVIINTDTIAINWINDNGVSVIVGVTVGSR